MPSTNQQQTEKKNPAPSDTEPLDPAVERVRRKIVRLLAISTGIMLIGFMAVILALVYKFTQMGTSGPSTTNPNAISAIDTKSFRSGNIVLPAGANIVESSMSGNHILLRIKFSDNSKQLWIYSLNSSQIVGKLTIN